MRIMPIQQNQISYQGTLEFRNQDIKTNDSLLPGVSCPVRSATIQVEKIESITDYPKGYAGQDNGYKTVINLDSGKSFILKVPYNDVVKAYKSTVPWRDAGNTVAWDGMQCMTDLGD